MAPKRHGDAHTLRRPRKSLQVLDQPEFHSKALLEKEGRKKGKEMRDRGGEGGREDSKWEIISVNIKSRALSICIIKYFIW